MQYVAPEREPEGRTGVPRASLRRLARRAARRLQMEYYGVFGPLPTPRKWVFIVGCYNSGTTLLHKLLASHEACGSMPREGQFCTTELPVPRAFGLPRLWALDPDRFRLDETSSAGIDVNKLKRQWGAHFNDPSRPVLLEKTPANAARMRWLDRHFESASFVPIIRNGFAVAEGIHRKVGHPVRLAARQWARSNEIMLADLESISNKKLVRYEELTRVPDAVLRDVLEFLGVDPAGFTVADRAWGVHRELSRVRNMNDRSVARLGPADRSEIRQEAGALLDRLGYTCDA